MSRIKIAAKKHRPDFVGFASHDLKRKGVTDTKGSDADKLRATGHRSQQIMKMYDKEVHVVKPTKN
jgi:hypothetical protein